MACFETCVIVEACDCDGLDGISHMWVFEKIECTTCCTTSDTIAIPMFQACMGLRWEILVMNVSWKEFTVQNKCFHVSTCCVVKPC